MRLLAGAIALPLAASAAADVPRDPLRFDIQCLVVTGFVAENAREEHRQAALTASVYYLGRIDGRVPAVDLEAQIAAESPVVMRQDPRELLRACGQLMLERGAAVRAIGERVRTRAQAGAAR